MYTNQSTKGITVSLLAAGLLIGFALTATAGDLEPPAPPAPTMKTLDQVEPRIPIPGSATPVTTFFVTQSGSYYLTGDRLCNSAGIEVQADNVTIDLMGYSLIGPGGGGNFGILMTERSNVEVRNGTIRNFGREGVRENSTAGRGHRIINVRAVGNGLTTSSVGIHLASSNNLVKDCSAETNSFAGIFADLDSTVTGNICRDNGGPGITVGNGSTVSGNTCSNNGSDGITASFGCTVTGNTCRENAASGIQVSAGCTIIGNTVRLNQAWGINLAADCLVDQNTATDNNQIGSVYANIESTGTCTYGLNHAP